MATLTLVRRWDFILTTTAGLFLSFPLLCLNQEITDMRSEIENFPGKPTIFTGKIAQKWRFGITTNSGDNYNLKIWRKEGVITPHYLLIASKIISVFNFVNLFWEIVPHSTISLKKKISGMSLEKNLFWVWLVVGNTRYKYFQQTLEGL